MEGLGRRKRRQQLAEVVADGIGDCGGLATGTLPREETSDAGAVQNEGTCGGHTWHGERVVEAAKSKGGDQALQELSRRCVALVALSFHLILMSLFCHTPLRFRVGFVSYCQPRFLPPNWNVGHEFTRDFGDFSIYR